MGTGIPRAKIVDAQSDNEVALNVPLATCAESDIVEGPLGIGHSFVEVLDVPRHALGKLVMSDR